MATIAPNVPADTNHRICRWFEHAEIKKICGKFLKESLDQPLLGLVGPSASRDMQTVCRSFIILQDARHSADYDPGFVLDENQSVQHVISAEEAMLAWGRIEHTAEANIFILSLLMFKNWEEKNR